MANRCYLYAITRDKKLIEIDETRNIILLTHKILLSCNTEKINSIMFEEEGIEELAFLADYIKGKEKLFNFLDKLLSENINNSFIYDTLKKDIEKLKEYFNSIDGEYLLLEPNEIFWFGENIKDEYNMCYDQIINIDKEIEEFKEELEKEIKEFYLLKRDYPYKGIFSKNKNKKILEELERKKNHINYLIGIHDFEYEIFPIEQKGKIEIRIDENRKKVKAVII